MNIRTDIDQIREELHFATQDLLKNLGSGRSDGVAYDTAWVARLVDRYDHPEFAAALTWLRQNQYADGTWGAPLKQFHDRYISTLAAIVALAALSPEKQQPRDKRRIKQGEDALWRLVGKLGRDDHDTIGFPILSGSLTEEACQLGLEVPEPPVRYGTAYLRKVEKLLNQSRRNWRENTLSFSLEALRHVVAEDDDVFDKNHSVAISPAATAGYLLKFEHPETLNYLVKSLRDDDTGVASAVAPIDTFEIAWSINHLSLAKVIAPHDLEVQRALDIVWQAWSTQMGVGYSSQSLLTDVDCTAASYVVLKGANYPVDASVFRIYEADDYFRCYLNETDPSMSANVRLLAALRTLDDTSPHKRAWIQKIVKSLSRMDKNGSFWTDKWHSSPYYVNSTALRTLHGLDNQMALTRFKWILRTQNNDGGWGYYEQSTPEETAYCLEALLWWDRHVERINDTVLSEAAAYLQPHVSDTHYTSLWIGKSLYTPHYTVKAAIIGAMTSYLNRATI